MPSLTDMMGWFQKQKQVDERDNAVNTVLDGMPKEDRDALFQKLKAEMEEPVKEEPVKEPKEERGPQEPKETQEPKEEEKPAEKKEEEEVVEPVKETKPDAQSIVPAGANGGLVITEESIEKMTPAQVMENMAAIVAMRDAADPDGKIALGTK